MDPRTHTPSFWRPSVVVKKSFTDPRTKNEILIQYCSALSLMEHVISHLKYSHIHGPDYTAEENMKLRFCIAYSS